MKRQKLFLTTLLAGLLMSVNVGAVTVTKIASMQDLIKGATTTGPTKSKFYQTDVNDGGVYDFNGSNYFGGISNDAVKNAFASTTDTYIVVAAWVYGQTSSNQCIFGYGDQSNGIKMAVNGTTLSITTKGAKDYSTASDSKLAANQWNFIAYAFKINNCSVSSLRYYFTTSKYYFSKNESSTMQNPADASQLFAIGSGNQGNSREGFNGTIANLTICTATGHPDNPEIAAIVGAAPTRIPPTGLCYINSGRGSEKYFKHIKDDNSSDKISLAAKVTADPNFMWYFATDASDADKVNLMNLVDGSKWGYPNTNNAANVITTNVSGDNAGYAYELVGSGNNTYPWALKITDSRYLSQNGGGSNYMGIWSGIDGGTYFKVEEVAADYDIYTVSISGLSDQTATVTPTSNDCYNNGYAFSNGQKMAWKSGTKPQSGDFTTSSIGGYKSTITVDGTNINIAYTEDSKGYAVVVNPSWLTAGGINYSGTNYGNGGNFEFTGSGTPIEDTDFTVNTVNGYTKACTVEDNTITITYTFAPSGKVLTFYHTARNEQQRAVAAVDNDATHGANVVMATTLSDLSSITANQKWLVNKVDGQDYYTLRSLSNGRYMNLIKTTESCWKTTTDITDDDDSTSYVYLQNLNSDATYNISYSTSSSYASAHEAGNQRIVSWGTASSSSRWEILATDAPTAEYKVSITSPSGMQGGITCKEGTTPLGNTTLYNTGEAFFFTANQDVTTSNVGGKFEAVTIDGYEGSVAYNEDTKTISVSYEKTARFFTLRYNYKINGIIGATEDFNQAENTTYPEPTITNDYYEVSKPEGTFTVSQKIAEGSVIDVDLTPTLKDGMTYPFTFSTDANTVWYYIKVDADNHKYAYYDSEAETNKTPLSSNKTDNNYYRWKFVGTPYGFKIINRGAGDTDNQLTHNGTLEGSTYEKNSHTFTSDGTDYVAMYSTNVTYQNDYTYIKIKGSANYYLNNNQGFYYWNNGGALTGTGSGLQFEIYQPKVELQELYDELNEITYGNDTQPGTYKKPDNFESTMSDAKGVLDDENATVANIETQIANLVALKSSITLNTPVKGRFYRFRGGYTDVGNYYITCENAENQNGRAAMSQTVDNKTIYKYNNDGYFVAYYNGKKLGESTWGNGDTGCTWTYEKGAVKSGSLAMKDGSTYLYGWSGGTKSGNKAEYTDRQGSAEKTNGYTDWFIEEVPSTSIYTVSFAENTPAGASVKLGEDRAVTLDNVETTPWIYSEESLTTSSQLSFGEVTNYKGTANIDDKAITVTYISPITLTYNYYIGETKMKSEAFSCYTGDNYPSPTAVYGITFTNAPTGTIQETADAQKDVTCTLANDYPITFGDEDWYYIKANDKYQYAMGANNTGHISAIPSSETYSNGAFYYRFVGNPFSIRIYSKYVGDNTTSAYLYADHQGGELSSAPTGSYFNLGNHESSAGIPNGGYVLTTTTENTELVVCNDNSKIYGATKADYLYDDGSKLLFEKAVFDASGTTASTTLTLNAGGDDYYYATAYYSFPVQITGATAFRLNLGDETYNCRVIADGKTPAETAVIVRGTTSSATISYCSDEIESVGINQLHGTLAPTKFAENTVMTLAKGTSGIGFYMFSKDATLGAHKAYILAADAPDNEIKFNFEDDTETGINEVNADVDVNANTIYNLAGQRVNMLQKGINIVNGKKVLY